jgi:hypothetical protein
MLRELLPVGDFPLPDKSLEDTQPSNKCPLSHYLQVLRLCVSYVVTSSGMTQQPLHFLNFVLEDRK